MEHHGAGLRRLLNSAMSKKYNPDSALEALTGAASLDMFNAVDRAIIDYALKLTRTPGDMSVSDVEKLRSAGLNDRAIHDVCSITAYFGFVNRIADGLGVDLEERFSNSG